MRKLLVVFSILSTFFAVISTSFAGDFATVRSIGFSTDGKYYAFEQYGVQDGSGFPYSEIFIIDTERDSWVKGTPLRFKVKDENASLYSDVRKPNLQKAAPLLHKLGIRKPGELLLYNPTTEISANSHKAAFSLSSLNPVSNLTYNIEIKLIPVPMPECVRSAAEPMGFSLELKPFSGGPKRVIHKDSAYKRLPKSRGCAVDYRLTHVIFYSARSRDVLINLVQVFSTGFEGDDGRFIAIPVIGRDGF